MISKKKLIELLKTTGRYQETDDAIIDSLYFQLKVMNDARKKLAESETGVLSAGSRDGKIMHAHPALKIYNEAHRLLLLSSIRLGLSERDRRQMGLEGKIEEDDGFEED